MRHTRCPLSSTQRTNGCAKQLRTARALRGRGATGLRRCVAEALMATNQGVTVCASRTGAAQLGNSRASVGGILRGDSGTRTSSDKLPLIRGARPIVVLGLRRRLDQWSRCEAVRARNRSLRQRRRRSRLGHLWRKRWRVRAPACIHFVVLCHYSVSCRYQA